MDALSWNEIRDRAIGFARDWDGETSEHAEKHTFWDEFFRIFGVRRRSVADFEEFVKKAGSKYGFIDVFWAGRLIVEHKSRGASMARAESQAFSYCQDLLRDGRHEDVPRLVVICDFNKFSVYDLEPEPESATDVLESGKPFRHVEFDLKVLHRHVREFAFIRGDKPVRAVSEPDANMRATSLLADLHDAIRGTGYAVRPLERFLVRCLFCLFAEDTGAFSPFSFSEYISKSRPDGSDLGGRLALLWDVLNTPEGVRQKTLDEELAEFPFVNGGLFAEPLPVCSFNSKLRDHLLECTRFCWARISPAVFGSLFQGVMDAKERRQIGGHYTSERDILKLLNALCLDDLREDLRAALEDRSTRRNAKLSEFQNRLRSLRFFDPACGCGNFLILAYRELRRLEKEALVALHTIKGNPGDMFGIQTVTDVRDLSAVNVDQFYGVEIGEWPARIAEVGLWLADHQCNLELGEALGRTVRRFPLKASPTLRIANALRINWKDVIPPDDGVFVVGNPPFVGKKEQNEDQKADMSAVWGDTKGSGVLDYVTCWYRRAAEYANHSRARCALVATNSISQGEQVGVLWGRLFADYRIKIHFAHRTFAWQSEARGKAHVHVVIIGFGAFDRHPKTIFEYDKAGGEAIAVSVRNINPYLVAGEDIVVGSRTTPINGAPPISYGSMMIDKDRSAGDDHGLVLTGRNRDSILAECPDLAPFVRRLYGGNEFINNTVRWCLWLVGAPPEILRKSRLLRDRIETVRKFRESSRREQTKALAKTPTLFGEIRQPSIDYLLIPKVSSDSRRYIPMGFLTPNDIASGSALVFPGATEYQFGVLSSAMHNAWARCVMGRMKSDPQYSSNIVYNNFPWPENVSTKDADSVEEAASGVLATRSKFPNSTLADLYDPLSMPTALVKAHDALDRAVDRCYRKGAFNSDRERVEYLFGLYEKLAAPLIPTPMKARSEKRRKG